MNTECPLAKKKKKSKKMFMQNKDPRINDTISKRS